MSLRQTLANTALVMVSLAFGLVITEVFLRLFTHFPIHAPVSNRVYDDKLLYRVDRNVTGIDHHGFRNPEIQDGSDWRVATIGDSHTYGVNVARDKSWPGQIEAMLGHRVYNFGIGSYGLLQYVETVRMAADSRARLMLIGFYGQNDLEICNVARLNFWVTGYFKDDTRRRQLQAYCAHQPGNLNNTAKQIMSESNPGKLRLSSRVAVYSFVRYLLDVAAPRRDNFSKVFMLDTSRKGNNLERCSNFERDFTFEVDGYSDFIPRHLDQIVVRQDKVFKNRHHLEPLFGGLFEQISRDAERAEAKVLLALIPTRLGVVHGMLAGRRFAMPTWVTESARAEERITDFLTALATRAGIAVVDLKPAVVTAYSRAIARGDVFYPCKDTHPREAGYRAYAEVMAPFAKELLSETRSR